MLSKRMTMWNKVHKKMSMPDQPIKPDGHNAYVMSKHNVIVAQQRMNTVGLPYNGIDSLVILRSSRKNFSGFQAQEIPMDEDSENDVTIAGFANGRHHAYGKYIDSNLFPKWKNEGLVTEDV